MKTKIPITTDTVTIMRDLHMQQVAELCNIDVEAIQALNPQYRTQLIPGSSGPMTLRLPTETLNTFIDLKDSVYNYRVDELLTRRSCVEVDDRLDNRSVASKRRAARQQSASESSSSSRRSASKSSSRKSSRSSSSKSSSRSSRSSRKSKKVKSSASTTVRKGDTLIEIAHRNGTTVEKLKKKNKIKGNMIKPGQKLKVK